MREQKPPVLVMKGIYRSFLGVQALVDVSFKLHAGEIHCLMGQNGAGKSTLIKVLTGVYKPDEGIIALDGTEIVTESPHHAQELGISTVYQEINLCPNLSVAENILIGREPRKFGLIDWRKVNRIAKELLKEKLNLEIDVTRKIDSYSIAIQQLVSVARALYLKSKVLILDEPTSSLDASEVALLFSTMRKLKSEGLAILFVTHFLDQTFEISDRITVLRNGAVVGEYFTNDLSRLDLISKMTGKDFSDFEKVYKELNEIGDANEVGTFLKANHLGRRSSIHPFNLQIKKGEVLGLAGLLGSGRTEIARLLFGIDCPDEGELAIGGREVSIRSPRQAMRYGIAFCPEDRKSEGLLPELSIRENIIIALQSKRGVFRYLSKSKQIKVAEEFIEKLGIKTPGTEQPIKNLSGGNQQKVILARWLATNPELLILDEPTRGIDISAKTEIQKLILDLAKEGLGVIFISSELEEVARCSTKVAVLRDRFVIGELSGNQIEERRILTMIAQNEAELAHV